VGYAVQLRPFRKPTQIIRAGVRHAPTSIACYFTHSSYALRIPNNCHGLYCCRARHPPAPPCMPLLTIDVDQKFLQCLLLDSALLVRWISPPLFRSPVSACCPHRLINAARSPPITSASVRHPILPLSPTGQPQFRQSTVIDIPPSFESRLSCCLN